MPRGRKSKKKQMQKKLNIVVAVLIVISILLAVLIYTNSGYLGKTLSPALGGVFGYINYLIPIGLFAFSLYIAYDPVPIIKIPNINIMIANTLTTVFISAGPVPLFFLVFTLVALLVAKI